jgi:hypothetical protein
VKNAFIRDVAECGVVEFHLCEIILEDRAFMRQKRGVFTGM